MSRLSWAFLLDSVPFTRAVRDGETSLGGSESACLGLARALVTRGHDVHVFATKLEAEAEGVDPSGLIWHPLQEFATLNRFVEWDVAVVLRSWPMFGASPTIQAKLRILWNQDLMLPGQMPDQIMSVAWAIDRIAYVSEYHRRQWEQLQPHIAPIGWVTRNGIDLTLVPKASAKKDPNRIIHISRPERGLAPLLEMWPKLKEQHPAATLAICRYSSMYDRGPGSWSDVCASYDAQVQAVQAKVGGIEYLGELDKPALYQAISQAAVMWYPGVASFAETSCIAALEAQACGTPFVGSYRGALPETAPSGVLVRGDAKSPDYQRESVQAVAELMAGCERTGARYRQMQKAGHDHVAGYGFPQLAQEWESQVETWFAERYAASGAGVLARLLHEDDHTAAREVARSIGDDKTAAWCQYVMDGKDQLAEHYAEFAMPDPVEEATHSFRFQAVAEKMAGCTKVLDVACGNGAAAIALARAHPGMTVTGLDYAEANIVRAREAAQREGLSDRLSFQVVTVYDFDRHQLTDEMASWCAAHAGAFDGAFIGEFVEHVVNAPALIDGLEVALSTGAKVIYTCPSGPYVDLAIRGTPMRKGHVHHFRQEDIRAVWGAKANAGVAYVEGGTTLRGSAVGSWIISYTVEPGRMAGQRNLEALAQRMRPLERLTVGIIAKNEETHIGRCLETVWKVADEILVGDTGSTDQTRAIAESYGARVLELGGVEEHPDGFSGVRNQVLQAASGDWFLWVDCDEQVMESHLLRRYLEGSIFQGFVLRQTHLYLDGPPTYDIPVRLFRRTPEVQFYGCVHEQPQMGGPNGDIVPTLEVVDVVIAHTGYLHEQGREEKRVKRNLPLLRRDAERFSTRELGKVLLIREAVIQGDSLRGSGPLTEEAAKAYTFALREFLRYFDDPAHKYHGLARPWYEAALKHLGFGWEQEIALAGKEGGLGGSHAKPERVWVRDGAEFDRIMAHKVKAMVKGMTPLPIVTDPDVLAPTLIETRQEVAV